MYTIYILNSLSKSKHSRTDIYETSTTFFYYTSKCIHRSLTVKTARLRLYLLLDSLSLWLALTFEQWQVALSMLRVLALYFFCTKNCWRKELTANWLKLFLCLYLWSIHLKSRMKAKTTYAKAYVYLNCKYKNKNTNLLIRTFKNPCVFIADCRMYAAKL